ncbi:MAG: ATP synthase F1 subunit delta [Ignavibacterium sp.]|jgi:F-type H+-transporting ATPase subunit delta|nr:ATP synthase F1 subunit delta [Ignavibacterium sp.]
MASSKVAIRYSKSFIDTSIEKNILDKVAKDFEFVASTFESSADLLRAIKSPVIKSETKKNILTEVFSNRISKDSLDFISFVITKGREEILVDILKAFESLKDKHVGVVKVDVTTAFDLSDDQKQQLQQKFGSYLKVKAILTYKVDKNLIGGFVARVGDTVYNASIVHQLGLLKKEFLQGSTTLN